MCRHDHRTSRLFTWTIVAALALAAGLSGCAYIGAGIAAIAAGDGGGGGGVNQPPSMAFPMVPAPDAADLLATIEYDLIDREKNPVDILVEFSTDGQTYAPATEGQGGDGTSGLESSPVGTRHVYIWNFFEDLFGSDLQAIQTASYLATLRFTLDDGVPRTPPPQDITSFRVGNFPPTITMVPILVAPLDPTVLIDYTVTDDFSDPLDLIVEFSLDEFATAGQPATILSPASAQCSDGVTGISSDPTGITHCFEWDYLSDIVGAAYPVWVRLTVYDSAGAASLPALSGAIRLGDSPPIATVTQVDTQFGVNVSFFLLDVTSDTASIAFEYSIDDGQTYTPSTSLVGSTSGLATSPQGLLHNVAWNALADIGTGLFADVRVRVTPSDAYATGIPAESTSFPLQNTDRPYAFIQSPAAGAVITGAVRIDYLLADFNADPVDILVEVRGGGSPTFTSASEVAGPPSEGVTNLTSSQSGEPHVFVWNSLGDLGPVDLDDVEIRITPSDISGVGTAALRGPFRLDNNEEPIVQNISTPISPATGNIDIPYDLVDAEGDPTDIQVQFSTDGGTTFSNHAHEAPFGSDGVWGLSSSPSGTPHVFVWNSLLDLGPVTEPNVVLRITPSDNPDPALGGGTAGVTASFIVDNDPATAPPSIDVISPAQGPPAGANPVLITGTGFIQGTTADIGGQALLNLSIVSATVLSGEVPPWVPGPTVADVTVSNPNGTAVLSGGYLYLLDYCLISSVTPATGSIGGGTRVTIDGFNLAPDGIAPSVAFGDVAAVNIVATDTQLSCDPPADPLGIPGGNYSVDVMIVNSRGHSCTQVNGFTYDAVGRLAASFGGKGLRVNGSAAGGNGDDRGLGIAADGLGRILVTGFSRNPALNDDMVIWRYNPDGTLDTTFNTQGWVIHDSAAGGAGNDQGNAIAIDGTDRILVAGSSDNTLADADMALWRFNPDGTLDLAFNTQGWVTHGNAAGGNLADVGLALTFDSLGRILVTGHSRNAADEDMALWRFLDTGSLDTGFNSQGWAVHHDAAGGNSDDRGMSITVDGADRILVAGSSVGPPALTWIDVAIWRYDPTGALDASFGMGGVAAYDISNTESGQDEAWGIALDLSGRILVAGWAWGPLSTDDMALLRLDPDGTLDATFGGSGVVYADNAAGGSGGDFGYGLTLDPQGGILVSGESQNAFGDMDMAIWRFEPTGVPDLGFGAGGAVVHASAAGGTGSDTGNAVALDGSGRIIVAGASANPAQDGDMAIWRYNSDGTPDPTFVPGGFLTHDDVTGTGTNPNDEGFGVAVDSIDRILVTGYSTDTDVLDDTIICAYNDDATLDASFGTGGVTIHWLAMSAPWHSEGNGILVDTLDRIVVGGWRDGATTPEMLVLRDDATGAYDLTFAGGEVFHDDAAGGGAFDGARGIALDGSGRIVLAGYSENLTPDSDMVIWRYNDDGTIDTTFDLQGFVVHDNAAGGAGDDRGEAVALDLAGNILVAGSSLNGAGDSDMVIWRYDPAGALDTTFNGQGWVIHDGAAGGAGDDAGRGIVLDAAGMILVAGSSLNGTGDLDMAIWRFDDLGALDTTFNGQGFTVHDSAAGGAGDDQAEAITLDSAGRIVVAGRSLDPATGFNMAVWRYEDTGSLDPSFGPAGFFVHDNAAGGAGDDIGYGLTLDSTGRILVAGSSFNGTDLDLVVWRIE